MHIPEWSSPLTRSAKRAALIAAHYISLRASYLKDTIKNPLGAEPWSAQSYQDRALPLTLFRDS